MLDDVKLIVWYEGFKIKLNSQYNPVDLIIYLAYPNGNAQKIPYTSCLIEDFTVKKEGANVFNISYVLENKKLTTQFIVIGYKPINYEHMEFKVTNLVTGVNYTEHFKKVLTFKDKLIINWQQFLIGVNELAKKGSKVNVYTFYKLSAPIHTGLSDKYNTQWLIYCEDEKTIKATIKEIYNNEVTDDGKN